MRELNYFERWYKNNLEKSEIIKLIDKEFINLDEESGKEIFKRFNTQAILDGYEGIMIKDPDSFPECKRSTTWLKLKTCN